MLKKNIFLASLRHRDAEGNAAGAVVERVICSADEEAARSFVDSSMRDLGLVSMTSLIQLEERAKKIRDVLKGTDLSWPVMIDPLL